MPGVGLIGSTHFHLDIHRAFIQGHGEQVVVFPCLRSFFLLLRVFGRNIQEYFQALLREKPYNIRASAVTEALINTTMICEGDQMACPESTSASLQWKVVPGFDAYEVSEYGHLRRRITFIGPCGRVIEAGTVSQGHKETRTGYWTYSLGQGKTQRAHVLVALAFIGPKPFPKAQVAHWDGNTDNNHYSNLRWATRKENAEDSVRHRTSTFGERNPRAKFPLELIRLLRQRYATEDIEQKQLAFEYGMSKALVCQILNNQIWNFPEAFP